MSELPKGVLPGEATSRTARPQPVIRKRRVLARVAGPTLSRSFENEHRVRGAEIRHWVAVKRIDEATVRVCGVRLADGEFVPADTVIVGIGIVPSAEPLIAAGACGGNGVRVDKTCSLANFYAIGDCALHAYAGGDEIRLESVQNANDMALTAAKATTGSPESTRPFPRSGPTGSTSARRQSASRADMTKKSSRGDPSSLSGTAQHGVRRDRADCKSEREPLEAGKHHS